MNVIWFSRHKPSEQQLEEILELTDKTAEDIIDMSDWAARNLENEIDLAQTMNALKGVMSSNYAFIFGVIPTPLRMRLHNGHEVAKNKPVAQNARRVEISIAEAWNIMRTPEGGKPTFQHRKFCLTGVYILDV